MKIILKNKETNKEYKINILSMLNIKDEDKINWQIIIEDE